MWVLSFKGVGAIFIATLALHKLPTPTIPPETSDDVLALTIQPITYFLVLCSIIVHGSSIPFFNLGRRVHTVTRTWTNRSESEPSWLARVKRAGADGNVDLPRYEKTEDEKEAQRRRDERDLEAGANGDDNGDIADQAFDDPGMDTGDFSARDYATGRGMNASSGARGNKISPAASSDRTVAEAGQEPGKSSSQGSGQGNEDAAFHQKDKRLERHDSGSSDEDETWDEGNDVVIDHHHGEDVEVQHKGKGRGERHDDGREHHLDEDGPGFPGHRFKEIEKLLGGGGGGSSDDEEGTSSPAADDSAATQESTKNAQPQDDLLHESSRRVAGKQIAEEKAAAAEAVKPSETSQKPTKIESSEARPGMSKGKARMSAQRLASMTGLARPQPKRKPSLTPEEKLARDAWCRKERKDIDDDQVKTWISGKHIVLERNNGEDVEIIDVDPSKEAREKAKKSKDVNLRELPIQQVQDAKQDVARERKSAAASSSNSDVGNVAESQQQQPKRFDLKSLRQNQSFKRLFGGEADTSESSRTAPTAPRGVPTIREDAPEDEAEARALPQTSSSADNSSGMTSIMRQRSRVNSGNHDEHGDQPGYLPMLRTGIPVERTETTDSQVRFGNLPKPSRR